jgi:hypothetical protein
MSLATRRARGKPDRRFVRRTVEADPVTAKGVHMNALVVTAAVLSVGMAPVPAQPPGNEWGKELAALEQKMLGDWKGQTGCAGNFLFRADGTYELTGYGPAPYDMAGTWKVRWDALPPTLVLTCKASEVLEEIGKITEVKLVRLDGESLAVEHADQTVGRYAREKK